MAIWERGRSTLSDAYAGTKESRLRQFLSSFRILALVFIVDCVIGFFVQWWFFGNTDPGEAIATLFGQRSSAEFSKLLIVCVAWPLWVIAGALDWLLSLRMGTNIEPHLPGGVDSPVDFRNPVVTK